MWNSAPRQQRPHLDSCGRVVQHDEQPPRSHHGAEQGGGLVDTTRYVSPSDAQGVGQAEVGQSPTVLP
jgi:hypothetical protein